MDRTRIADSEPQRGAVPDRLRWFHAGGALLVILAIGWAYWPTLGFLAESWQSEPDYSHGYLVLPVAIGLLWLRRSSLPAREPGFGWGGVAAMLLAIGVRWFSVRYYVESIDAYSLLLWPAGIVWFLGGRRLLAWSLPAIAFLVFMIPLPFRVERMLAVPLQTLATDSSCWGLQLLGQPAIAEGNSLIIGDTQLDVAEACAGLRIFVAIVALAYACAVLGTRPWWEKLLILASAIPVALAANTIRIIATALLYQYASSSLAISLGHDLAGWFTIPLAAALYAGMLWYLARLFPPITEFNAREMVRSNRPQLTLR